MTLWPRGHVTTWCHVMSHVTWCHVTNYKENIFSSARSMATKLGRVVIYDVENSPIITLWSREVMWQIENLISPLLQGLWPPNMASSGIMVRETYLWSYMIHWQHSEVTWGYVTNKIKYFFLQKKYGHQPLQGADVWWGEAHDEVARLWSRDHKRSCIKLKTQCLLLQGLHDQSWQGGDIWGQKATHRVTCFFDYAVLWGHMENLKRNISFSTRHMVSMLGKWKGCTHKTKWLLKQVVTRQIKKLKIENYNQGNI